MTVLFVVLTIALFLVLDWLLHRGEEPAKVPVRTATVRVPGGVFFAPSHTWLNLFPSGRAWLGVDDFVLRLLDHPRVKFLAPEGARVGRGEPVLALEDRERRLVVKSPLDARVVHRNEALGRDAGLDPTMPFDDGWALELEPEKPRDLKSLLLGDETREWMREEHRRLRDLFASAGPQTSPVMLQDGGTPVPGALRGVDDETWNRFEREFLDVR